MGRTATPTGAPGGSPAPTIPSAAPEADLPGTTEWRVAAPAPVAQLAAYTDAASAAPGESVGLRVRATCGPVTVTAYRMGWYAGTGARVVWRSEPVTPAAQPPPRVDPDGRVTAGNALFWRTRFEDGGRTMVGYKEQAARDPVHPAPGRQKRPPPR